MPVAKIISDQLGGRHRDIQKFCRAQFCQQIITDQKFVSKQMRGGSKRTGDLFQHEESFIGVVGNTAYYHIKCAKKLKIID